MPLYAYATLSNKIQEVLVLRRSDLRQFVVRTNPHKLLKIDSGGYGSAKYIVTLRVRKNTSSSVA